MKKSRMTTKTEMSPLTLTNCLPNPNLATEGVSGQLQFPFLEESNLLRSVSKKSSRLAEQMMNADDVGGEAILVL